MCVAGGKGERKGGYRDGDGRGVATVRQQPNRKHGIECTKPARQDGRMAGW